jgi:hypothetical protein
LIWTPLTTMMVVLGVFAISLTVYAVSKAWSILRGFEKSDLEQRYDLEKGLYLVSTVVWVVLVSRIVAMGLFWVTNESLIPLVPGAMCQYGVFQAGAPFSWISLGVKLLVLLVYGIWLSLDIINRKCKGAPLSRTLALGFIFLVPLLIVDAGLDLAFYLSVTPVTVPCCRVVFTAESPVPCPFCFVFHDVPMLIPVIVGYGLAIATGVWGGVISRYTTKPGDLGDVSNKVLRSLTTLSLIFAVIGTVALVPAILQIYGGAVPLAH